MDTRKALRILMGLEKVSPAQEKKARQLLQGQGMQIISVK